MNNPFANKKLKIPFYKSTITLVLTPGKMLLLGLIVLATVIWFFFLGLLLGRGEYPERSFPEISKVMPQSNETDVPMTVLTVEPSSEVRQNSIEEKSETKEAPTTKNPPTSVKQIAEARKSTEKQITVVKKTAPKQTINSKTQATQKNNKKVIQEATKKETQTALKTPAPSNEVFDYVYQIASFKEEKSANAFANKVKKTGLKTRVTSSKSGATIWSRVVIDFRGTPNETNQLREQLKPFKVDKIVMLKKKAIKK